MSVLPTADYFFGLQPGEELEVEIEEGKTLILGLQSVSEPDERGIRIVMCTINGQLRPINVRDRSVKADAPAQEKADPSDPRHVAAAFGGVVTPVAAVGDHVEVGDTVATIEAMKMEAVITTSVAGVVDRFVVAGVQQVEGGDLVVVIAP